MNAPRLAVLGCLALVSCGRTPAPVLAVPTPTPSPMASRSPVPQPTAIPSPAVLPTAATPEQFGSTLRLRVAFGGMPASDTAAALLRQGEITGPDLSCSDARLVLALLKGWDENRLRNADARLVIYRRKVDAQGNPTVVTFPAKLVRFDPATGLALVTYADTFDYALDAGFRLQRADDSARRDLTVLRTSQDGPREKPGTTSAAGSRPRGDARFSIDSGTYRGAANGPARMELPDLGSQPADTAVLAVGTPDLLYGFVEATAAGPQMTGLERFDAAMPTPMYGVARIGFEKFQDYGGLRIKVTLEPPAEGPPPEQLSLRVGAPSGTAPGDSPAPGADGSFAPVAPETIRLSPPSTPAGPWTSGNLPLPPDREERFYLMQLSWPVLPGKNVPENCGKPFVVKIANRPEGIFPEVIATPPSGPDGARMVQEDGVSRFPLEAPALEVHLVAGGREALIHLSAPPFWKRFSFEKNDWQPLPENLSNCMVTGNLAALFVLDLDALEVRKYRLPDLTPGGATKLPAGDYHAILAGTNTARTPVHLALGLGMMSLDPDTLETRSSPPDDAKYSGQRYPGASEGPTQFYISGDGRAVVRAEGGSSRDPIYYNTDARGFERTYLGRTSSAHSDYIPGITPGFTTNSTGVVCSDTRGGAELVQPSIKAPWNSSLAALSENAPVAFRVLTPRDNELPPRVRLGCFAPLDGVPFAEIEAPELAGLRAGYSPGQRWVFLDPYSRRLATLDFARRTWRVRSLRPADVSRPALLNWPDTSVARGGVFTFRPVLVGGDRFTVENTGRPGGPAVDTAAGTVSLPVAAGEFDSLQLLTFKLPASGGASTDYPLLVHAAGSDLPFAAAPGTTPDGLGQRGADLATLGASSKGFIPLKAALYPLSEPFPLMVGPTAGHIALVARSGRVAFFSMQARRVVAVLDGPAGASYYAGLGGLLQYDPARRTLTRLSVPEGRREAALALPANMQLTGLAVGADPGNAVTLALRIDHAEQGARMSDLVLPRPWSGDAVAILDGMTLKAGFRAQVSTLARLPGQPEPFPDTFGGSVGQSTDSPPVLLPSSRDGTMVTLSRHFVVAGPGYAVGCPWFGGGLNNLTNSPGGLAGGSISGLMAFAGNGIGFKAGVGVWPPEPGTELGSTPDGRYRLHQLGTGLEENSVEVRAAENNRPLLRLGRMPFLEHGLPYAGREEVGRRVLMLGDTGPLAVLNATGRTLALVDLDIAALTRQLSPDDCHVVSQPVPYVVEGRTLQYSVQVNNPAAVQSIQLQQAVPGLTFDGARTVSYTPPAYTRNIPCRTISLEIKTKKGQVFLHEFPVYVLPLPRAGIKAKTGQL